MSCERFHEQILDAAAGKREAELDRHLLVCATCREQIARERELFAAMDAGLQFAANAPMPATLLAGVRTRLESGEAEARGLRFGSWAVMGALAAAALALGIVSVNWSAHRNPRAVTATSTAQSAAANSSAANAARSDTPKEIAPTVETAASTVAKRASRPELGVAAAKSEPKVIVPAGQEEALLVYAARAEQASARIREPAPAILADADVTKPMEIASIEWKPLKVQPLTKPEPPDKEDHD